MTVGVGQPAAQRELQRFLDAGDIELIDGNYRPSARAIYGVYRRLQPPQARQ